MRATTAGSTNAPARSKGDEPDPETTLACWAWLLRALHHARVARDAAREELAALSALDPARLDADDMASTVRVRAAWLAQSIATINASERACLDASAALARTQRSAGSPRTCATGRACLASLSDVVRTTRDGTTSSGRSTVS